MTADHRSPAEPAPETARARLRLPSPALAVAMLALCVALGGVAVAAIPGPGGVIKGCYRDGPGLRQLSIVDTDAECPSPLVLLPFNQQGPAGSTGPQGSAGLQGPVGAQGAPGPQGPAGVTKLYATAPIATSDKVVALKEDTVKTVASLSLPAGSYLLASKASVRLGEYATSKWKNLSNKYSLSAGGNGACELWVQGPGQPKIVDTAKLNADRSVTYSLGLGGKPILGESVAHELFVETTMSLMHAVDLNAAGKVDLRCVRSSGQVELSDVKLVAVPAAGLAIGPQPTLVLAKPGKDATTAKLKPKARG